MTGTGISQRAITRPHPHPTSLGIEATCRGWKGQATRRLPQIATYCVPCHAPFCLANTPQHRPYAEPTHLAALTTLKNTKLSELAAVQTEMRHLGHLIASLTADIKDLQRGGDQWEIAEAREKRLEARGMMDKLARKITRLECKVGHVDWQIRGVMAEDERGDWRQSGWNGPRFTFVVQDYA